MNGHARDLLNALQVELGIGGQLVKVGDADGAVAPACQGFVNRHAAFDFVCAYGQDVDFFAVEFIARADFQFFEAIQDIEFGDAQASQTVDLCRAFEQRGIKPAAAAVAPSGGAAFCAHGAHVVARGAFFFPIQFGGKWA